MPASGQDTDQLHRSHDAFYHSVPGIAPGVVAAVANKLARPIWAMLAKGQSWRANTWRSA
jgi:hypothetical protein